LGLHYNPQALRRMWGDLAPDEGTPAALGKGIVRGATETTLDVPRALAIGEAAHNRELLATFDRLDRGEDIGPIQDWHR
jgi:hypothetical protein